MINPVIYVFLNKGLHMSTGKAAAQAAHAAVMGALASSEHKQMQWVADPGKYMIVLEGRDANHMNDIAVYLTQRGFIYERIVDEGVNEIDPHSTTAIATLILDKDNERVIKTFGGFSLYRDTVKINLEFER